MKNDLLSGRSSRLNYLHPTTWRKRAALAGLLAGQTFMIAACSDTSGIPDHSSAAESGLYSVRLSPDPDCKPFAPCTWISSFGENIDVQVLLASTTTSDLRKILGACNGIAMAPGMNVSSLSDESILSEIISSPPATSCYISIFGGDAGLRRAHIWRRSDEKYISTTARYFLPALVPVASISGEGRLTIYCMVVRGEAVNPVFTIHDAANRCAELYYFRSA